MNEKYLLILFLIVTTRCASSQQKQENKILPAIYNTEKYVPLLSGKRIGVVANKSSKIQDRNLIDTLIALRIDIKAVFTPEHGFSGEFDAGLEVDNEQYHKNTIPVFSLYGDNKKPTNEQLAQIDLMVFDLQDVGVRFFTYLSTLHYVMQACAELNIPLIVLDRPNPNSFYIDGPVMEKKYMSFVGLHPVPVVYGMTIGEYSKMINGEGWLGNNLRCNLQIINIDNYSHQQRYYLSERPSPNLPDMRSIYLYPSLCFFEGTVMSVGRGTQFPFQTYGHPNYPQKDFSFIPVSLPGASKDPLLEGQKCFGVDLRGFSIDSLGNLGKINLNYIIDAYKKMKLKDKFFNNYFNCLTGTGELKEQIMDGLSADEIRKSWYPSIEEFKKIRVKYLLYPD